MPAKLKSKRRRVTVPEFDEDFFDVKLPTRAKGRLAGIGELTQVASFVTLRDIQNAIRMSEFGEPYFLFSLFRDMEENDSHLQAEIGKRIMSFVGKNEQIEPQDKNNKDDIISAEVIADMISNCDNWSKGSIHLANGHIWPIAGCEKLYEAVPPDMEYKWRHKVKYRLKKMYPIPYALYTYKISYQNLQGAIVTLPDAKGKFQPVRTGFGTAPVQDIAGHSALSTKDWPLSDSDVLVWNPDDWQPDLRFYSTYDNGMINWDIAGSYKPDPIRHVLHSANVATGSMRENFGGVLRSILPWWYMSGCLRDWWARGMEQYGSPFAVAYANTNNKNIFDLLTKAFNQASKIKALIVPPQAKVELKEINYTSMSDAYAKAIEVCDTQKTKAILGQTLSTSSKGSNMMGGSGVADLHGEVRAEWTEYDKRVFSDMQWKQIFEPFLRLNGYRGRCKSVRGGISPNNLALFSKTLATAAQAGVFPDEAAEQDLTALFGIKMKIVDMTEIKMQQADKSKTNKKNYKPE